MRSIAPLALLLAACQGSLPPAEEAAGPDWNDSPAPSFLDPTSDEVAGHACAFTAEDWQGEARELLEARWDELGGLRLDGVFLETPADFLAWLGSAGAYEAERAVLALNLAMNGAGIYGRYADFAHARLLDGPYAGTSAAELLELSYLRRTPELLEALGALDRGFGGCDPAWYLSPSMDIDRDGVPVTLDCDDTDATVGTLLYEDDLSSDSGWFSTTPQLDDPWVWDGDSVYATSGGQQVLLGSPESWDDVVAYVTLSAKGTMPGCGFSCEEACGEYVPEDCYSDWQALGLGILTAEVSDTGVVTFTNTGDYDVCFEGFLMWDSPSSQGFTIGQEVVEDETYRVPAGGSLEVYYGSWTTDNGSYSPYLDEPPFWCYQAGTAMATGTAYTSIGALLPEDMQELISGETDTDGDGVEDHLDWAGSGGVQTQYALWDYQESHAAVVVGKLAESDSGVVRVTLTVQNRGALAADALLEDTVPEDWAVVSCSVEPDADTPQADGTETLQWNLHLDGCTDDCATFDEQVITCELDYNLDADLDIVELPAASVTYDDGEGSETSWSMPAAAFDYDDNGDGLVSCGSTDRWRAGVLLRAALDDDQDEGYHGYRCALAHNSAEDCYPDGPFLQIAEFMDAPEDDISSECADDCPENTTFDQLARVDHDGSVDLSAGDTASLAFWAVGDGLLCRAYDASGSEFVEAEASDTSFTEGTTGFSTLNMFGDFDDVRVCEAYALPTD